MAGSVIPLKNGFIYQSFYFWKKALELLDEFSEVETVSYELDEAKGFDDIVVEFKSEKFTSSGNIKKRYYQVKYHEVNKSVIGSQDLMNPAFINAKSNSFLQKAKDVIDASTVGVEVILINSWRINQEDILCELIRNDTGSFDLSKLKQGITAKSRMGKVRTAWADHLGINEEELYCLLGKIKIQEGKTMLALIEDLNVNLREKKLRKIDEDYYNDAPYLSLINDLHAKIGKGVILDREVMIDHFSRAKIFTNFTDNNFQSIGIKSFLDGAEDLQSKVNKFLDLSNYFPQSQICENPTRNNEVKNAIQSFVKEEIEPAVRYTVHLEANQSIAFTVGYYAHQKTGKYLYPIQKGFNTEIWEYSEKNIYFESELECKTFYNKESEFVMINIDLMDKNLKSEVREYLKINFPDSIVDIIDIYPTKPTTRFVEDGNHCMKLATEVSEMLQKMPSSVKRKEWRFAFTAPNSFILFLGQNATLFGDIQLLEYDKKNFTYRKSISL